MRKVPTAKRRQLVAAIYTDASLSIEERSSRTLGKRFGVSHRTILNDLVALGVDERLSKPPAGGISKAERQRRVRDLYPTHTCAEIARELGCSDQTVKCDVHELGLEPRKPAPRRKHPEPERQLCECECGELARPGGRFVDWSHYVAWARAQAAEPRVRAERPGPPIGSRRHGRLVKCKAREHEWCPHGETGRWVPTSQPTEFLSQECWARYRSEVEWTSLLPLVLSNAETLPGPKRRKWKNRANGLRGHRPRATTRDGYAGKRQKVIDAIERVGFDVTTGRPHISERTLERMSGLARRQVRAIIAEHAEVVQKRPERF